MLVDCLCIVVQEGHTALHLAAQNNETADIVEYLVGHGADVNRKEYRVSLTSWGESH